MKLLKTFVVITILVTILFTCLSHVTVETVTICGFQCVDLGDSGILNRIYENVRETKMFTGEVVKDFQIIHSYLSDPKKDKNVIDLSEEYNILHFR